jgi:pimeloyl-ACP methyl ester carboxylesterase
VKFPCGGHELDWEERGEGRPILLVHGLTTDRRIMAAACDETIDRAGRFRRIYLDLPGHGASRGNPELASADHLTELLALFLGHVAPNDEVPVVAYAYGAYLALALPALRAIGGLFLFCPVVEADFGKRTVAARRVASEEPDLPFSDDPRERDAFLEVAVHQSRSVLAEFQQLVHPANVAVDANVVAAIRARYAHARPYAHAWREFAQPVAIVCGRDDHWVGFSDALAPARAFPHSSYAVVADCGQLLPLEKPLALRVQLADWLTRL